MDCLRAPNDHQWPSFWLPLNPAPNLTQNSLISTIFVLCFWNQF